MALTRRGAIMGAAGAVSTLGMPAVVRAQQAFRTYPFTLGVAAGDADAEGFVIWTRLAPEPLARYGGMPMAPITVQWEVAEDEGFDRVVANGETLARPELGHSVHVELADLKADRVYWYRFQCGRERSMSGRVRTLPMADSDVASLRFGVAGCQNYEDGLYTAWGHLAEEDPAFVFHYGDYIYEGGGSTIHRGWNGRPLPFVRSHTGQKIYSLDDYRQRYAEYKMDQDLQAAHAAAGFYMTFDDHEIENNWVGDRDQQGTPPETFLLRRAAALQAWYEHMPVRRSALPIRGGIQIYRRAQVGNLIDLHLLDTRQFRSDQPCDDGFEPRCPGWSDERAQVLGKAQEDWLFRNLKQGTARWNALAQQVMVMPINRQLGSDDTPIRNMDSWGGYDAARERLLARLSGLGNAIVLTGDEHQNYAGTLRRDAGEGEAVGVEFVSTSISSGGDGSAIRPGTDRIMRQNPYVKYMNDQRGYLLCDVTPDRWEARFRTLDYVTRAGAPVVTARTATVERGVAALHMS
ncbi:alkaline phosphatase [Altererythrobacter endophyticus]|uniref:Alkaline phosphatase n=1 Tax=Altericroceibacterium endophyticum TaxID=1808508 RepID=A0A6I4TB74_9SPHN|nr:alkaline phosphatase [Altericroceibacterium endophyticum]